MARGPCADGQQRAWRRAGKIFTLPYSKHLQRPAGTCYGHLYLPTPSHTPPHLQVSPSQPVGELVGHRPDVYLAQHQAAPRQVAVHHEKAKKVDLGVEGGDLG